jgi:hypothetical protein
MGKTIDRPRSDLSGLTKTTKEEFEAAVAAAPSDSERFEWRRPGTIYYARCEVARADGTLLAAHDENGDYWVRKA